MPFIAPQDVERPTTADQALDGQFAGTRHATTTKGLPVRLGLYRGIEAERSYPWVMDLIEAHGPDGPVGYLKVAYIPKDVASRYVPTAFHFAVRQAGIAFDRQLLDKPEKDWSREELQRAISQIARWDRYGASAQADASDEQLAAAWEACRDRLGAAHQERYERFLAFHVDRPEVAYISVYSEEDAQRPYVQGVRSQTREPVGAQRQGVATCMYETAALWLARRGLLLHASTTQTSAAQDVWADLDRRGMVRQDPNSARRVLNVEALSAGNRAANVA